LAYERRANRLILLGDDGQRGLTQRRGAWYVY